MTNRRKFTITCSLLAGGVLVQAQTPPAPPVPVSPPEPAFAPMPPRPMAVPVAVPQPAAAPRPAAVPEPPTPPAFRFDSGDFDFDINVNDINVNIDRAEIQERVEAARAMADQAREDAREAAEQARENMRLIGPAEVEMARAYASSARAYASSSFAFAPQVSVNVGGPAKARNLRGDENNLYQRGTSALDGKRWDDAAAYFGEAANQKGSRADGALYWKAYALKKLGKPAEAQAAIAELRKSYASSRWLDDAKALELDLGKPVSPEAESDEELKLLALNGIMQSDPERAIPLVENQLKSSASPRVKKNALFVLAQSSNPRAQTIIEQIARGGGNPDLQVKAIMFLTEHRRPNAGQLLSEIYTASNDQEVKRAVLNAYVSNRDKDRLLAAVKSEKNSELRSIGINYLGNVQGNPELWQLYQAETTVEGKEQILRAMWNNGNSERLLEVIRNEKEPRLRRLAIDVYASQKGQQNTDTLVQIYGAEQDPQIKNAIVDRLSNPQNVTALIGIAKAEKDTQMKIRIVERISNMAKRSKEAQQYLEELLK